MQPLQAMVVNLAERPCILSCILGLRAGPVRPSSLEAANGPGPLRGCGAEAMQGPGAPAATGQTRHRVLFTCNVQRFLPAEAITMSWLLSQHADGFHWNTSTSGRPMDAMEAGNQGNWRSPG